MRPFYLLARLMHSAPGDEYCLRFKSAGMYRIPLARTITRNYAGTAVPFYPQPIPDDPIPPYFKTYPILLLILVRVLEILARHSSIQCGRVLGCHVLGTRFCKFGRRFLSKHKRRSGTYIHWYRRRYETDHYHHDFFIPYAGRSKVRY